MELNNFLLGLDDLLKAKGLRFVIVRNYEELPIKNLGNDIDVIVPKESVLEWLDILDFFCKENNLDFQVINKHRYVVSTLITGVNDKNNQLKLDINNLFNWRGVDFYQTDFLVKNSVMHQYPIFTAKYSYINWYITFCHSFLYGGFINPKYIKQYRHIVQKHPQEFSELLSTVFTKSEINYLIGKINAQDFFVPRYKANAIRIFILLRSFIKKPIYTAYNFILSFR